MLIGEVHKTPSSLQQACLHHAQLCFATDTAVDHSHKLSLTDAPLLLLMTLAEVWLVYTRLTTAASEKSGDCD